MTHRVGPKGQVVIPKPMRDALGLRPGDEVAFHLDGRTVRIELAGRVPSLMGIFAGSDLIGDLEAEHRAERVRDARR